MAAAWEIDFPMQPIRLPARHANLEPVRASFDLTSRICRDHENIKTAHHRNTHSPRPRLIATRISKHNYYVASRDSNKAEATTNRLNPMFGCKHHNDRHVAQQCMEQHYTLIVLGKRKTRLIQSHIKTKSLNSNLLSLRDAVEANNCSKVFPRSAFNTKE